MLLALGQIRTFARHVRIKAKANCQIGRIARLKMALQQATWLDVKLRVSLSTTLDGLPTGLSSGSMRVSLHRPKQMRQ